MSTSNPYTILRTKALQSALVESAEHYALEASRELPIPDVAYTFPPSMRLSLRRAAYGAILNAWEVKRGTSPKAWAYGVSNMGSGIYLDKRLSSPTTTDDGRLVARITGTGMVEMLTAN